MFHLTKTRSERTVTGQLFLATNIAYTIVGAVLSLQGEVVLGIFSLAYKIMPFNMEINQAFIAAVLTVIGYSLNDTVVVFDRIREYRNINTSWEITRVVNTALNSTLSRTLNTSFTTSLIASWNIPLKTSLNTTLNTPLKTSLNT